MNPVVVQTGNSPLILDQPHGEIYMPDDIAVQLNENVITFADTDWHINWLFDFLVDDVTVVEATSKKMLQRLQDMSLSILAISKG